MNKTDYPKIIENLETMINTMEYDSTRSPGKAKINAETINAMYSLVDRYKEMIAPPKPSVKPAEVPKKVTKKVATKKEQ